MSASTFSSDIHELIAPCARAVHEAWRNIRTAQGWRHGICRDTVLKQHPLLIPYEELPPSEQNRNIDAVTSTLELLTAHGFLLRRDLPAAEVSIADRDQLTEALSPSIHSTWAERMPDRSHPCMVPFDALSLEDQLLDTGAINSVLSFYQRNGFRLYRTP